MKIHLRSAVMESVSLALKDGKLLAHVVFSGRPTEESVRELKIQGAVNEALKSASMAPLPGGCIVDYQPDGMPNLSFSLRAAATESWRFVVDKDSEGVYVTMFIKICFEEGIRTIVDKFMDLATACGTLSIVSEQAEMFPLKNDAQEGERSAASVEPEEPAKAELTEQLFGQ